MSLALTKAQKHRAAAVQREAVLALAYQRVFQGEDGRRVLDDIFDFAGLGHDLQPRTADNGIDASGVLRNDGKRALALHIGKRALGAPEKLARHIAALIPVSTEDDEQE